MEIGIWCLLMATWMGLLGIHYLDRQTLLLTGFAILALSALWLAVKHLTRRRP